MRTTKTAIFVLFLAAGAAAALGQTDPQPAFGITFSGFVKTDLLYDSRQTVSLREGHYLLYPKGELLDPEGRDINAASSFHMLSVQTRLLGRITGPDAFGAKTSGLVETEFFGTSDSDLNGFRLRHAYLKLNWARTELMVGQFWHPMFITESFPEVVSFNTGAPFQPFNRSPQVRLTRRLGARWSVSAAVLAQRDFVSNGPEGAGSVYARNAVLPELNLKLQWAWTCPSGCEYLAGASVDYLTLRPRLASAAGYAAEEKVSDWAGMLFFKYKAKPLTVKAEAFYGQNPHHLTMLGGYGVAAVTDAERDLVRYASLNQYSVWADVMTNGAKLQVGLFLGYSKNLGAKDDIIGAKYGRGLDIDALTRVAPRILFNSGKVRFAGEIEYTNAAYGAADAKGKVTNAKGIGNLRLLGAVYYFF